MPHDKLDNPVWHSLDEVHREFAIDYGEIRFYHPAICPFGGYDQKDKIADFIDEYSKLTESFFIVGEKPVLPRKLQIIKELICLQMIINDRPDAGKQTIVKLDDVHRTALFELVNLVQPGYFREKTSLLGDYFGIFKNDKLVAVTGERMKTYEHTEVSAVVTHPDHTGKGYAKHLLAHTVNNIFDQGKLPYLHVAETNTAAITLYEKLGFTTRRKISFWNISRSQ